MLNSKKLKLSYKRYCENFAEDIKLNKDKRRYLNNFDETTQIVKLNDIEKDHILLINLGSVQTYSISKWKRDVLIEKQKRSEELKKIMMVTFQQCMGQPLYQMRYPKMYIEYSFKDVVITLIHFTMFGWQKEEEVLFHFISQYFGNRLINADDLNQHSWFLLELYLQYRDQQILATQRHLNVVARKHFQNEGLDYRSIPEDLAIYCDVLEQWTTPKIDEIQALIEKMILHHSLLASEVGNSSEFGDYGYAFYPYEILFLLYVRKKKGLPVPTEWDDFLMNTPEAKMDIHDPEPYPEWDPLLKLVDDFYRKNYPDYIPNQYGELFKYRE